MDNLIIGLNKYGVAVIYSDESAIDDVDEIVSSFHYSGKIPPGYGCLRTDGVSKIWRDPESEDDTDQNKNVFNFMLTEMINQI